MTGAGVYERVKQRLAARGIGGSQAEQVLGRVRQRLIQRGISPTDTGSTRARTAHEFGEAYAPESAGVPTDLSPSMGVLPPPSAPEREGMARHGSPLMVRLREIDNEIARQTANPPFGNVPDGADADWQRGIAQGRASEDHPEPRACGSDAVRDARGSPRAVADVGRVGR